MAGAPPVYGSLAYAHTLSHAGRAWFVPGWDTPVLLRPVPDCPGVVDAMGAYPVCTLPPHADLGAGLEALRAARAVSVALVADPLAGPAPHVLARHFGLCRPYKTHHLIERCGQVDFSKHHRDRIRRGERHATARLVSLRDPVWRAHWGRLHAGLVARHGVTGVQAFPPEAFDQLAALQDQLLVVAVVDRAGAPLAMQIWVRQGDIAYSHLTATSEAGYQLGATYVAYAAAIEALADCQVLDLGGGAGDGDDPADSLAAFKRGFANASAMAHLCGAVLDDAAYARLSAGRNGYFPAYRG